MNSRHRTAAWIVTPLLALTGWLVADFYAVSSSRKATTGESHPLVAQSNCRYASGACDLKNEDFVLRITVSGTALLSVRSALPLEGVFIAVGNPSDKPPPKKLRSQDSGGSRWLLQLDEFPTDNDRMLLVARSAGIDFFGEAPTTFLHTGASSAHFTGSDAVTRQ
ncbi:MAG: hypothetical protein AAF671_07215 [Pseudomonadota bacterium]